MPWLHIKIPTLPEHTDALEDALLLAGCQAVTLVDSEDQPVFEPIRGTTPLWHTQRFRACSTTNWTPMP